MLRLSHRKCLKRFFMSIQTREADTAKVGQALLYGDA